ncbi:MAG TPA: glutamine-hydrolyzing carbamoyl-phosphate synthase small subunit [Planctomycetota bacterium]|nr:glutamine-hydrolyzing carbamoyl-phosphate synthase small subunit [Planctomycetota bacterium]
MKLAKLALEDGTVYTGRSFGAEAERSGEVVFNTAMSGYQEVLTDPSYKGQIVTMTYPHIGNYGTNEEDWESGKVWVEGFVAREFSKVSSNFRSTANLDDYFKKHGIPAIDDVDTRALTRKLRMTGALNAVLSSIELDDAKLVEKAKAIPKMSGLDLVKYVTSDKARSWKEFVQRDANGKHPAFKHKVAVVDCGVKYNIVRSLVAMGCDVTVYPANTPSQELEKYDGVCLSNGPGDPEAVTYTIESVKGLLKKEKPIFGICLGHQILGLALGAKTYKLKFGHHGANHPIRNEITKKVEITSQNHGFCVEQKSLEAVGGEVTHVNLNDGAVEGLRHKSLPVFSVQYHPEAAPGPHDASYLFHQFLKNMEAKK